MQASFFDKFDRVIFNLVFLKAITGPNFKMKRFHHGLFPANFEKFLRFLPKHSQANTFVPFRPNHCSQNSCNILPITLRQLPLCSSTKATIIWHSKQTKTLYSQWFGAALWNSLSEKKLNIHRKTGTNLENFERGHWEFCNGLKHGN